MKRPRHPRPIAPLSPREHFQIQQALIRHEEIMRARNPDSILERISRSEGEYERLRVLAALRAALTIK